MVEDTLKLALSKNYPMILIFTVVLVTMRLVYLITKKQKFVLYKELFLLTFLLYSLVLFYVVTFQDINYGTNNFVPFHEIMRYEFGSSYFVHNILGNIIMFIPFGFFVSTIMKSKNPLPDLFVSLVTSVVIEFTQYKIGRTVDVDDIILNMLGAFLGYLIFVILYSIREKLPEFTKKDWFRNILIIIVFGLLAFAYYNIELWGIIR